MLAILAVLAQVLLAAGQRMGQFAVLRALGLSPGRATQMLLIEQALVYAFGLGAGSLLGGLLLPAILPVVGSSQAAGDPALIGAPPEQVVLNLPTLAGFYLAFLMAVALALVLVARHVGRLRPSAALRHNEDESTRRSHRAAWGLARTIR